MAKVRRHKVSAGILQAVSEDTRFEGDPRDMQGRHKV